MWLKPLLAFFVFCLLGAIYGIYRLHRYAGPKAKKEERQAELDRQTWLQQKQLVFEETDHFLDTIDLPSYLLEPRIYNQQLELLKYPDNKKFGDWRYESNEEMIIAPLQRSLKDFLDSLKRKGLSVKGFEDEFLAELTKRLSIRNYRYHAGRLGNLLTDEQDLQAACFSLFERLGLKRDASDPPRFITSLSSYYKEPMVFKSIARDNHDFTEGIGMLDFFQKYLQVKGISTAPIPIKEFSEKLEDAFRRYTSGDGPMG